VLEEKLTQRGFAACLLPFEKLPSQSGASPIKGLHYVPGLLSPAEHDALVGLIDGQPWLDDLRRRVQHYGYKYDDKARRIDASMRIADLPDWLKVLAVRLSQRGFFEQLPDQVSINEYLPGQGIDDHVDCPPCFADTIATLSLGSPCVMNFTCKDDVDEIFPLLLEPSSVVVLKDEARYDWMHGIDAVKYDDYQDRQIKRSRRISLTFRKVLLSQERA
jgi:alkylated DNA repair dioxygenase AlkB